jgi:hypothetical protein
MPHSAACNCGQLRLTCEGQPVQISMCHCLECQRRTGAMFGSQAWFQPQQITAISGDATEFTRPSASGRSVTFRFCPVCGSTVYWEAERFPNLIAVAVGSFADPTFPPPKHSVWERRRHLGGDNSRYGTCSTQTETGSGEPNDVVRNHHLDDDFCAFRTAVGSENHLDYLGTMRTYSVTRRFKDDVWKSYLLLRVESSHSPPTRVPFSATERFISKTTNISASIKMPNSQKQSK